MIGYLISSIIIILILGYIVFNLLKKVEKQEEILFGYNSYLNKISDIIDLSDKKLKIIDEKGSFKSDDEIGYFFNGILEIQAILNSFSISNIESKK